MTDNETLLRTENLTKEFGDVVAVQDLNLTVKKGEIYGFLGPNGAGKTTTIHMVLSLVRPTAGRIQLFGEELDSAVATLRERIGVLSGHGGLYGNLTAREHVEFVARIKATEVDPDHLCERVGLASTTDRQVRGFSTGMKQRLKLAMALVGEPDLLVLDEPTRGLDPNGAREVRQLIETENQRGTTVFFSSHILSQIERTCDKVGILNNGTLVAEDTISELRAQISETNSIRVTFKDAVNGMCDRIENGDAVAAADIDGDTIELALKESGATNEVLGELCKAESPIQSVTTEGATLEDLFAAYTEAEAET